MTTPVTKALPRRTMSGVRISDDAADALTRALDETSEGKACDDRTWARRIIRALRREGFDVTPRLRTPTPKHRATDAGGGV